jgi:6-phosphofructokinase 1
LSAAPCGDAARAVAVLTSGGDAPGMNAAIRAVVRAGLARGLRMFGVRNGFAGLTAGDFITLGARDVGGIIGGGGTMLGSSRCPEMKHPAGQAAAAAHLRRAGIDTLVVIGGNGSQAGAAALSRLGAGVLGIASTIDNDLAGTDVSIGATTALETALGAIDRLRDTAASHHRAFLVETMGRDCGYLALVAGITGGAEAIVIPEAEMAPDAVASALRGAWDRGKSHAIVVVAEGARNNAEALARYFDVHARRLGFELRVTRLGHIQRGGSPCAFDRLIATRLGAAAIEHAVAGKHGVLLGLVGGEVAATEFDAVLQRHKVLDPALLKLAEVLAA